MGGALFVAMAFTVVASSLRAEQDSLQESTRSAQNVVIECYQFVFCEQQIQRSMLHYLCLQMIKWGHVRGKGMSCEGQRDVM